VTAPVLDRPYDDRDPPAAPPPPLAPAAGLDRPLDLGWVRWLTAGWIIVAAVALTLRLAGLGRWALSPDEARGAFDAWLLLRGQPPLPGDALPATAPFFLLLQTFGFFLFGVGDTTARLVPALAGLAIVPLAWALRPIVGRPAALGMAALAAFSPTLVFASRTGTPEMPTAALSLLLLVALLRLGAAAGEVGAVRRWAVVGGIAAGALLASGPAALTVLLSLAIGIAASAVLAPSGAVRGGLRDLAAVPGALLAGLAAFALTVVVLFTRLFTDPAAIVGAGEAVAAWGQLLVASATETPVRFFLLALLLYEPLALLFALVAALRRPRPVAPGRAGWAVFGGWFIAAFCLWSFSAGRAPEHAVFVALPLVLLGGGVLGETIAAVDWRDVRQGFGGGLALALLGLLIALAAFALALDRGNDPLGGGILPAIVLVMVVVVPLAYVVFALASGEVAAGRGRQVALIALLVPALFLGALAFRSAVLLANNRAGEGTELLAQGLPTEAVRPVVESIQRLSRDVTLDQGSVRDVPGGHGLVIAADRSVRWPFQWYFREFPDFRVVDPGQAPLADAQVVIAPDDAGLAEAGYTPRRYAWLNRVPPAYLATDAGPLLRAIVSPARWSAGLDFLLHREGLTPGDPQTIAVGLDRDLAARVFPATGAYDLGERPGRGAGQGQFDRPIGVAVAANGETYVVDQGNSRVQRFAADGSFVEAWGADSGVTFDAGDIGVGPTGVEAAANGLVYVADTGGHRVVVFDEGGDLIREIGGPPDAAGRRLLVDIGTDPAASSRPGEFFGPRDVAVSDDEVFVVDTGNERVQVFGLDGAFRRAWGGFGTGPGQLFEPVGIALGPDGRVYVADSGNGRISVFTPDGQPVAQWRVEAWPVTDPADLPPTFQPYLAFGPDGTLYATAANAGTIERFAPDGSPLPPITDLAEDEPLEQPVGIAVAPEGDLLVSDLGWNAVLRRPAPGAASSDLLDLLPIQVGLDEEQPPPDRAAPAPGDGAAPTSRSLPPPPGGPAPASDAAGRG
jgi:uncharacterized protein (TIGR03663 family)